MVRISRALISLTFILAMAVSGPALANKNSKSDSQPNPKYASIVIDGETGAILSQTNADKILHPASLTKMMTLMLTFEALESGKLRPTDRITISKHAAAQSPSKLGLAAGSKIRVQDAIYAVVTKSANDISVALAEAVGGTEANFVKMMNARAHSIGMNRTVFRNPSGLPDARQVSTARDMAKLGRHLIYSHTAYYSVFNKKEFVYNGVTYRNHNRLMDSYAGMDGLKTGFINASGFNLVASAKRGNQRLIAVVFGGKTTHSRNTHMASLLDKGFKDIERVRMASNIANINGSNIVNASASSTDSDTHMIIDTAPTITGNQRQQNTAFQAGTLKSGDRLTDTAPHISSFAQTTNTAKTAQSNQSLGTMRIASLNTANDAQPAPVAQPPALYVPPQQNAAVAPMPSGYASEGTWSIQVGAFQSRVATDQAIYRAMHMLPPELSSRATPMIVPLRTAEATWVFRARLAGFNQQQAEQACSRIKDCLTVSPQAY
jgi:D-alanyl-D-alanine carboxypeptidase